MNCRSYSLKVFIFKCFLLSSIRYFREVSKHVINIQPLAACLENASGEPFIDKQKQQQKAT